MQFRISILWIEPTPPPLPLLCTVSITLTYLVLTLPLHLYYYKCKEIIEVEFSCIFYSGIQRVPCPNFGHRDPTLSSEFYD